MKAIKLLGLILIISILIGCEKDKQYVYSSNLIGEWAWVSTCGGFSGLCSTPETTNLTVKLVYSADSMYYEYQNNSIISSYQFHFKSQISEGGDTLKFIQTANGTQAYSINDNALYISFVGADFWSTYKRIK
jgi:hypothetical protein